MAVIFAGLVLFALGMGIACRVSRMEGTLRDLFVNQYADSKLHRRDVEKTIDELWLQIGNKTEVELAYDGTLDTFPRMEDLMYVFVLNAGEEGGILRSRSNIPDRKVGPWEADTLSLIHI